MKTHTGDIERDTPLLPEVIAGLITDDPERIRALANRARRHFRDGLAKRNAFWRKCHQENAREHLFTFISHWNDSMRANYARYRMVHAADFQN